MKKRNVLPIGTVVRVKKESFSEEVCSNTSYYSGRLVIKKSNPRYELGVIVGGTYLRPGVVHYDYDDGNHFTSKGNSYFVYLVRPAYTMKPMKVMPEDLEVNTTLHLHYDKNRYIKEHEDMAGSPIPFSGSVFQWNKQAREELSEIMSTMPRDEKGRWK